MAKFKKAFVVTGSIGSGKSTFINMIKNLGFKVVDADKISHDELDRSKDEVVDEFTTEILTHDKIDRKKLGNIVFNDKQKLKWLENLLHPKIKNRINLQCQKLESENKAYFVDIPLFYESLSEYEFDNIVLIYAPKQTLIQRIMKRNELGFEDAKKRVELQMDIEQKRKMADFIIDNSKDLKHLKTQIDEFMNKIE